MWTVRHTPRTLDDLILPDPATRQLLKGWVDRGQIPHVLFHGPPGTGKTTAARVLCREVDAETLEINASLESGIDTVRDRIGRFVDRVALSGRRVVLLDEADRLSDAAQASLRGLLDRAAALGVSFLLTANWRYRIIEPLRSRCVEIAFEALPPDAVRERARSILEEHGVDFNPDVLDEHIDACGGDIRALINALERASSDGRLLPPAHRRFDMDDLWHAMERGSMAEIADHLADLSPTEIRNLYRDLARSIEERIGNPRARLDALVHVGWGAGVTDTTSLPDVVALGVMARIATILQQTESNSRSKGRRGTR